MSKQLTFVFTGILENHTRTDAQKMVEDFGHLVSNSVKRTTNYLVAGIRPGSKLQDAKDLSVKVLSENEFANMMGKMVRYVRPAERPQVHIPPLSDMGPEVIPGKYFLVGKVSWEYNDEGYSRGNHGDSGIEPTKLFRRRSAALEEKAKLEKKSFDTDVMEYVQEGDMTTLFKGRDYEYFRELYYQYFGIDLPEDEGHFEYGDGIAEKILPNLAKLTMERFINITRFMKFGFYEIHEVAIGD